MDPSRPSKRQKLTPIPEQRPLTPNIEKENWREFNSQLHLRLHPNAGASGTTMVADFGKIMVDSCSALTSDVWKHFKTDHPSSLLNFGLMSSIIVSTCFFKLFPLSFLYAYSDFFLPFPFFIPPYASCAIMPRGISKMTPLRIRLPNRRKLLRAHCCKLTPCPRNKVKTFKSLNKQSTS